DDGQPGEEVGWGAIGFTGNQLELSVPAAMLGIDLTQPFAFDFHWADNIQQFGQLEEFFLNGDHAPDRRFNYRYHVDVAPKDEDKKCLTPNPPLNSSNQLINSLVGGATPVPPLRHNT